MSENLNAFIEEGMKTYKEASRILVRFGKEIENRLKNILKERKEWGKFTPRKDATARSTTYWSEYPLLNAKIDGTYSGQNVKLVIAVNWYQSNENYPFYAVWFEPHEPFMKIISDFNPPDGFNVVGRELQFNPSESDFDLERDFKKLLDEFVKLLETEISR